jgi:competence protein ComEC
VNISSHRYPIILSLVFLTSTVSGLINLPELAIIIAGVSVFTGIINSRLAILAFVFIPGSVFLGLFIVEQEISKLQTHHEPRKIELSGYVLSQEVPSVRRQKLTVLVYSGELVESRIIVNANRYPDIRKGQLITVKCFLEYPEAFDGFNYPRYLASKNIYYLCQDAYLLHQEVANFAWSRLLEPTRIWIANQVGSLWPKPVSSLALGLILGTRESFPEQTLLDFQRSGITHIIALSGFNITILVIFLERFLIELCITKKWRLILIVLGIIFFTIFVGAGASITRAAIMGSMGFFARYSSRLGSPFRLLVMTAAIMTAFNPFILLYDLGFQLSFISTLGLVYLTPSFDKLFFFFPNVFSLKESLSTTMAATIATLPLILSQFEQLSIVSPLANMLILPIIPWLMALGALAVLLSSLSPVLALPFTYSFNLGSQYLLGVSTYFSNLSWAATEVRLSFVSMLLCYLILIVLYFYVQRKQV